MAEGDPACSAESQAQLRVATEWPHFLQEVQRISKRMGPWVQQRTSLETPEETLRLEKERLKSEKQSAQDDLQDCIRKPDIPNPSGTTSDHDSRLKFAFNRVGRSFVKLEDFKRDSGKKLKELQEAYEYHTKELEDTFPILDDLIPEDVLRFVLPRLSPSKLKTLLSGNNGTQFRYERSWSEANASHTRIPSSPAPASSLPPPPRRSASSQATSLEQEQRVEGPERTSEDGGTINVRLAGTSIPAGGVASSSAIEEAEQRKRKRLDSPSRTATSSKKTQVSHTSRSSAKGGPDTSSRPQGRPCMTTRRTIQFNEVYANGNAAEKHWIVEHKDVYYILLCEADGWKFEGGAKYAPKAARAHLRSGEHGKKGWTEDEAIRHVGIEVLNCDANGQKMNNEAHGGGDAIGNRPRRKAKITRGDPRRQEQRRPTEDGEATPVPVPGQIYRAPCFKSSRDWRPAIFIPRGCFRDPSFADVGLEGCLEDSQYLHNVPLECYRTSPETGRITGWQDGYEDGGKRVGDRKYPIMHFDDVGYLLKHSLVWRAAAELGEYDYETHASEARAIPSDLSRVLTRRKDTRASVGTQVGEALVHEISTEATVETTDRQDTSGANPPDHTATADHSSSSLSIASGYFSAHAFELVRSDIVSHVASEGDVAPRNHGRQGTTSSNHGGGRHGSGSQTQAQVGNSTLRASYAVFPDVAGQLSDQTLNPTPRAEHSGAAVSLDGLAGEEAGTLGPYSTTMQPPDPELRELSTNHNSYSSPRPGHQPLYGQSPHHSATIYESSAQLSTSHQDTYGRRDFPDPPRQSDRTPGRGNWIAEDVPVPFQTQQDPSAEAKVAIVPENKSVLRRPPECPHNVKGILTSKLQQSREVVERGCS